MSEPRKAVVHRPAPPPAPVTRSTDTEHLGPDQLPTIQTERDALAAIDAHIANLCRQMGQTYDALALTRLRAEVLEAESRKKMVVALFAEGREREQQLMAKFMLYKKGVPIEGAEALEVAAEMDGLNPRSLSYEQFRGLLLNTGKLEIAGQDRSGQTDFSAACAGAVGVSGQP